MDDPFPIAATDNHDIPVRRPRWVYFITIPALLITLLIYGFTDVLYYWSWKETGFTFSNPGLARQVYQQWIILRVSELVLALGCLVLIFYGGRKRWHPGILIGLGCIVAVIWVLWCYQPVWTPQR